MSIGKKITEARGRTGDSQKSLAEEVFMSQESISKYENGSRRFPKNMHKPVAEALDDEQFYFEAWEETTGFVSIPYFDGAYIDRKASSMVYLVKSETNEALLHVEQMTWFKPANQRDEAEKEAVERMILELLDAAASMVNLVAELCKENHLSMKAVFRTWRVSLKARKYEA